MNENGVMPTMPMVPASSQDNGMFGGSGNFMWIILLFLLLGGNGLGGLGGANSGANGTAGSINNDFLYTQSKIDALGQQLITLTNQMTQTMTNGFNGVTATVTNGFANVQQDLCNLRHHSDANAFQINRNIDQVRFEGAQNTCTITTAVRESERRIEDMLAANALRESEARNAALQAENVNLRTALSNSQQTAEIFNVLAPRNAGCCPPAPQPVTNVSWYYPAPPPPPAYGVA